MNVFYAPWITGDLITLDEQESKHGVKVLRIKEASRVYVTDGAGTLYEGTVLEPDPKGCVIQPKKMYRNFEQRSYKLHLAVAPTKNINRYEWFIEKAVEIGVDEITPFTGFHSERRKIKPERLERILIAAMKQSLKAYKPALNPLVKWEELLEQANGDEKYIAHCREHQRSILFKSLGTQKSVFIAIGPEGDFSDNEVDEALNRGFGSVSLGNARLRTETAAVAACHTVSLKNQ